MAKKNPLVGRYAISLVTSLLMSGAHAQEANSNVIGSVRTSEDLSCALQGIQDGSVIEMQSAHIVMSYLAQRKGRQELNNVSLRRGPPLGEGSDRLLDRPYGLLMDGAWNDGSHGRC